MEVIDFLAVIGAAAFALLAIISCLRWELVVLLVLASAVSETYFGLDLGFKLESLTLHPVDALATVCFAAGIIRLFTISRLGGLLWWWLGVFACWGLAVVYGASGYGLSTALGFYRQHFYLSAIALYLMTFDFSAADIRRVAVMWVFAGVAIMLFCWLAKLDPSFVSDELLIGSWSNAFVSERVIVAGAAMVMGQAALIGLGGWAGMNGALFTRGLTICLIITVFLQYHRSTWLATFAGAIAMMRGNVYYLFRLTPIFVLVLGCIIILWLAGLASGQDFMTAAVTQAIREPLDMQQSTALWRIEGWRILVGEAISQGPLRIIFGGGFGVGYERQMRGTEIVFSPHSMYVEIFLNAGLMGLLSLLGFFALLLRRAMTLQKAGMPQDGLDPAIAVALIVSVLVYSFSYSLGYDQAILIGTLAAALETRSAPPQRDA